MGDRVFIAFGGGSLIFAAVLPTSLSIFAAAASAGFSLGLAGGPQAVLIMNMIEGSLAHLGSSAVLGAVRVFERGGSIIGLLVVGQITGILGYSGAVGMIGIFAILGAGWFVALNMFRRTDTHKKGKS